MASMAAQGDTYEPSKEIQDLVSESLLLAYAGNEIPRRDQVNMLRAVVQKVHHTAQQMLCDPWTPPRAAQRDGEVKDASTATPVMGTDEIPAHIRVAPPRAFFSFRDNGHIYIPLIDWSAFRGYSLTFWINIDEVRYPENREDADARRPKFQLFRFTNNSSTLGVEATIEFDDLAQQPLLTVGCCAPGGSDQKRSTYSSVITPSTGRSDWRSVSQRVSVRRGQWHLLTICHSLHYVKKSKVTCYVDTTRQFSEELIYPSGLVNASKCSIGGGYQTSVRVANVSMNQDELTKAAVEVIFSQGPTVYPFRRLNTVPAGGMAHHLVDLRDSVVLSPLTLPVNDRIAKLSKAQVVFSFSASDLVDAAFPDLATEWLAEGSFDAKGKWITLEALSSSSEIQQRNARLGKQVIKFAFPDARVAWYRTLGVEAIPVLLHCMLKTYERLISEKDDSDDSEGTTDINDIIGGVVVDLLWILKGVLLNHSEGIYQAIREYVLHLVCHVLCLHKDSAAVVWNPSSLVVCVQVVRGFFDLLPVRLYENRERNHPTQPSLWLWNPLFASAVRSLLLEFRLWSRLDSKTQSIYNHQLYSLACEHPKLLNDLGIVPRILEVLRDFYSNQSGDHRPNNSNSQHSESAEKEQQWKQQSVQALVDVLELCLTNQSVHVHEPLEQELTDTTFARESEATPVSAASTAATPDMLQAGTFLSSSSVPLTRRKGGVFYVNLESIIWSDQSAGPNSQSSSGSIDQRDDSTGEMKVPKSALPCVQVRLSLVRDLREVIRFLLDCQDPMIRHSVLLLLRRLSVSYLDMRFALISSNVIDCLLNLMRPPVPRSPVDQSDDSATMSTRLACLPLFVYLLEWLESVQGRTVWCGLEEHLRSILNGEGNYTRGFLELMMEFYFDPAWLTGVQHSIIMNDPSKRDSVLFPIAPITRTASVSSIHDSGIAVDDSLRDSTFAGDGYVRGMGLSGWIKAATAFSGKRLSLAWEKRVQLIRLAALRNLSSSIWSTSGQSIRRLPCPATGVMAFCGANNPEITDIFDESVTGITSLPLKGILPFLPILLARASLPVREKVLMDINVKLKMDDKALDQILAMKKDWAEAMLEIAIACSSAQSVSTSAQVTKHGPSSADANKIGEDLVVDTIVSLLSGAMHHVRGWRSFVDVIAGLKLIQFKYTNVNSDQVNHPEVLANPLDWLSCVTGIVLQRMARSRTMLSKVIADNVQKIFFLVQESLLVAPHVCTESSELPSVDSRNRSSSGVWSESQAFLLNSVLDMCTRLVESTHKLYRVGLSPGLQIIQHALAYAEGEILMERMTLLLETAYQQEMNIASPVRIYDHLSPRQILLSALVCLRRALLVQQDQDQDVLPPLQLLTLKICTSGVFLDDLHANGVDVHILSDMTEAQAAAAVLDALGLTINETEMHEREEAADFVPHFPTARDFRESQLNVSTGEPTSSTGEQRLPSVEDDQVYGVDENERSLWAALEVEENRVQETFREVVTRKASHEAASHERRKQRDSWLACLWEAHEYRFLSQHKDRVFVNHISAFQEIAGNRELRVGVYETPLPARLRRPLEFSLSSSGRAVSTDAKRTLSTDSSRKKFALALEMIDSDPNDASSTVGSTDDEKKLLLEKVGRLVAEQGGGEIRDITNEIEQQGEREAEASANQATSESGSPAKLGEPQISDDLDAPEGQTETTPDKSSFAPERLNGLPPKLWHVDVERHLESGLDPGEGFALAVGEQILAETKCRRVIPEGLVSGTLYFTLKYLVFVPKARDAASSLSSPDEKKEAHGLDESAPGLRRCWRWKYKHIVGVLLRRYRLRDSAIEIFMRNGSNHFLEFPHAVKQQRNELARLLYSFLPRNVPKQWPGRAVQSLGATTKAWQNRQISNYEYLMALNTFAGRSFNDLTQYPVFPWVLKNYEDDILDLSDEANFRDLSKPMGALNPDRLEEYWERYHSFDDPVIPKFLYGSHYSTCAGVVLFFLFRLQPFADLQRKMQGNEFDLPDRLFHSIKETWNMCNSQMSEVKELTPEFYSDASFLKNLNKFELGKRHDQVHVGDVDLPTWAKGSPEEFIRFHRAALESEFVSAHLHEWIDLIFGFKQRGKAALKANNVFYYLTYYGVVDLDLIEDPYLRESMELQIAHFGQCPMQLFYSPHPSRNPTTLLRRAISGGASPSVSGGTSTSAASTTPTSSGNKSPLTVPGPVPGGAPVATVSRPLSAMFQDPSIMMQERRQKWGLPTEIKPVAESSIRWVKIFPDRFLTVNELGVIELYHWKLVPKPVTPVSLQTLASSPASRRQSGSGVDILPPTARENRVSGRDPDDSVDSPVASDIEIFSPVSVLTDEQDDIQTPLAIDTSESAATCPWLLEVVRDVSPFDVVPRVPVFEEKHSTEFPIVSSSNGRVLVTGGAPNGSIQLRLLDLDNGHVIAKASVTGHDDRVSCLSIDRFSSASSLGPLAQDDGEDLLLSGSRDGTLALWRLSHLKPDLLLRLPRVSACPMLTLRGHAESVIDCCVNTYLNVIASCSEHEGVVHFIHDNGAVAFSFRSENLSCFKRIMISRKGFIVASMETPRQGSEDGEQERSDEEGLAYTFLVYNLAGVLVRRHVFDDGDKVSAVRLSKEGDVVVMTLASGIVRICRLDDFVVVQEYKTSGETTFAPTTAISFGPEEAVILLVAGRQDGSLVLHLLPDADGSVSFLANLRRLLGVSSKLKMVKGTVQQAQNLAWTTLGNAKAVTSTARDIAGEAIGEAKSIVRGFISYLRQGQNP